MQGFAAKCRPIWQRSPMSTRQQARWLSILPSPLHSLNSPWPQPRLQSHALFSSPRLQLPHPSTIPWTQPSPRLQSHALFSSPRLQPRSLSIPWTQPASPRLRSRARFSSPQLQPHSSSIPWTQPASPRLRSHPLLTTLRLQQWPQPSCSSAQLRSPHLRSRLWRQARLSSNRPWSQPRFSKPRLSSSPQPWQRLLLQWQRHPCLSSPRRLQQVRPLSSPQQQ